MDEWLELCRAAAADVGRVLLELPGREEREPVRGAGVGGDDTTAIDEAAERAVVDRLRASGRSFTLVSEELGEDRVGSDDDRLWVVLDPIDGSNNAKRGLPFFALSLAVASGPTMADVEFAYVYDLGTGEEWTARRGGGAYLDGRRLGAVRPKEDVEILVFEATTTATVAERAPAVVGFARRLRVMGSLALSLCHLAAGRVDAVCSLKPARAVDIAAAQLLVRECALAIALIDVAAPFDAAPLDLEGRSRVAAAGTPEVCRRLAAVLAS